MPRSCSCADHQLGLPQIGAIYEGTSNIQLETIAKFIKKEYA